MIVRHTTLLVATALLFLVACGGQSVYTHEDPSTVEEEDGSPPVVAPPPVPVIEAGDQCQYTNDVGSMNCRPDLSCCNELYYCMQNPFCVEALDWYMDCRAAHPELPITDDWHKKCANDLAYFFNGYCIQPCGFTPSADGGSR